MTGLFLPLDVNYYHDEEFHDAGAYAELLYIRGNCWVKANARDGRIARSQLALFAIGIPNPTKHAAALVLAGLWQETGAGWFIPAYLKRNRSKAQIDASRAIASEAGQRGAHERWHVPPEGSPNPKCAICITERMGSPHRIASAQQWGSDALDRDITRAIEKPEPEPEPEPLRIPLHPQDDVTRDVPEPVDNLDGLAAIANLADRLKAR